MGSAAADEVQFSVYNFEAADVEKPGNTLIFTKRSARP